MLIPSRISNTAALLPSLSRRVNANSQPKFGWASDQNKLIKKGEC